MNTKTKIFFYAVLILSINAAFGYEITTHALITQKAYERSVLNPANPNSVVTAIGFDRLGQNTAFDLEQKISAGVFSTPVDRAYYDDAVRPTNINQAVVRLPQQQERTSMQWLLERGFTPGFSSVELFEGSIPGWLMRGSIREDDNDGRLVLNAWATGDDRDLDPYARILRAVKHFYDPVRDLAYPFIKECDDYECLKSTNWAMGAVDPLSAGNNIPDVNRRNHFTWQDAREDYFYALTLLVDENGDGARSALERQRSSWERTWRFASTIGDLGHVVHLLQDTAQPQHVRSDAHAPPAGTEVEAGEGLADASIEAFTDYRVLGFVDSNLATFITGNPLQSMDEALPGQLAVPPLIFGSYPGAGQKIQFSTPIKFFTTRHVDTSSGDCGGSSNAICARRGLADFTNRSFFTSGTTPGNLFCTDPERRPFETDVFGNPLCPSTQPVPFPYPPQDLTDPSYSRVALSSRIRIGSTSVFYNAIVRQIMSTRL